MITKVGLSQSGEDVRSNKVAEDGGSVEGLRQVEVAVRVSESSIPISEDIGFEAHREKCVGGFGVVDVGFDHWVVVIFTATKDEGSSFVLSAARHLDEFVLLLAHTNHSHIIGDESVVQSVVLRGNISGWFHGNVEDDTKLGAVVLPKGVEKSGDRSRDFEEGGQPNEVGDPRSFGSFVNITQTFREYSFHHANEFLSRKRHLDGAYCVELAKNLLRQGVESVY